MLLPMEVNFTSPKYIIEHKFKFNITQKNYNKIYYFGENIICRTQIVLY